MNTKAWSPLFRRFFVNERAADQRDTQRLYEQTQKRWKASPWSKPETFSALTEAIMTGLDTVPNMPKSGELREDLQHSIEETLALEEHIFSPLPLPDGLSLPEHIELRRLLRARNYFLDDEARTLTALIPGLIDIFRTILNALPLIDFETPSTMTIALYDAVNGLPNVITRIITTTTPAHALFDQLTIQLARNICTVSGVPYAEVEKKQLTLPNDAKLDAPELVAGYLAHTPLLPLLMTPVPFSIGKQNYCRHGICVARPGWGKSQLLASLLYEAVQDPEQRSVILIDPHGPLYTQAKERMPPERTVLVDCDTNPPDLNIFDFGVSTPEDALNTFEFLLSSLAGGLSEKQQGCVEPLFALLTKIPGATLETLHDIVVERPSKKQPPTYAAEIAQLDKIQRDFFNLFYGSGDFDITKAALQWKISRALTRPAFRKMFSAPKNSLDLDRFIKEKRIMLVKGGEKALGREGMRILLLYLLSQFYAAGKRREGTDERTWHLGQMLIDEAHLVLQSNLIKPVLQELRKFNFSFLAATQLWDDVSKEARPAILGATAIKIIGDVQRDDAELFAREMHTDGRFIQSLKQTPRSHADWAFYVTGMTDRAVRVRVPYGTLEAMKTHEAASADAAPISATTTAAQPDSPAEPQPVAPPKDADPLIKPGKEWQ